MVVVAVAVSIQKSFTILENNSILCPPFSTSIVVLETAGGFGVATIQYYIHFPSAVVLALVVQPRAPRALRHNCIGLCWDYTSLPTLTTLDIMYLI